MTNYKYDTIVSNAKKCKTYVKQVREHNKLETGKNRRFDDNRLGFAAF